MPRPDPGRYTTIMQTATARIEDMSPRARWGLALCCIALGTYPILVAVGVIEPEPGQLKAPLWVVGLAGFLFVVLGVFVSMRQTDTLSHVFGAVVCLSFSAIGTWAALYAEPGSIKGGLPLVPAHINHQIGRVMFGLGALMCLGMALWAMRMALRSGQLATD